MHMNPCSADTAACLTEYTLICRLELSDYVVSQLEDEPAALNLLKALATKKQQQAAVISSIKQYLEAAWQAMPPPFLQVRRLWHGNAHGWGCPLSDSVLQ